MHRDSGSGPGFGCACMPVLTRCILLRPRLVLRSHVFSSMCTGYCRQHTRSASRNCSLKGIRSWSSSRCVAHSGLVCGRSGGLGTGHYQAGVAYWGLPSKQPTASCGPCAFASCLNAKLRRLVARQQGGLLGSPHVLQHVYTFLSSAASVMRGYQLVIIKHKMTL